MLFQEVGSRKIVGDFSGGTLSSDGGVLLLRQVDRSLGLTRRLAACFGDQRDQRFVEHSVPELLAQRLYGQVLGYEDINDHEQLRRDPLLAAACGKRTHWEQSELFIAVARWPRLRRSIAWSYPTTRTPAFTNSRMIPESLKRSCWTWGCAACPNTRLKL